MFFTAFSLGCTACILYVAPRLTTQNSFGMMMDGFPVKDRGIFKMLVFFTLLAVISVLGSQPALGTIVWVFTANVFMFFAFVSGWAPFYSWFSMFVNYVGGGICLMLIGLHTWLLACISTIVFIVVIFRLAFFTSSVMQEQKRYNRWIKKQMNTYIYNYDSLLPRKASLKDLVVSIIFIEDMSRPAIVRVLENILHKAKGGVMSTGIMQVQSPTTLTNKQSVALGIKKVRNILKKHPTDYPSGPEGFYDFAEAWNGDRTYCFLLYLVYDTIKMLHNKK